MPHYRATLLLRFTHHQRTNMYLLVARDFLARAELCWDTSMHFTVQAVVPTFH